MHNSRALAIESGLSRAKPELEVRVKLDVGVFIMRIPTNYAYIIYHTIVIFRWLTMLSCMICL